MTGSTLLGAGVLIAALVGAGRDAGACAAPSVGVDLGVGLEETHVGGGLQAAGTAALGVGWSFERPPCAGWPVRVELGWGTSTRGPPWWRGPGTVRVSSWTQDFSALAGFSLTVFTSRDGEKSVGVEILTGPDLRVQTVTIQVLDTQSSEVDVRPRLRVAGGVFTLLGAFRFTLRLDGVVPEDAALIAGFGVQI